MAEWKCGGGLLAAWKALPGLLIGRLLTGVAVGLAAGVAVPYLIELRLRADPNAPRSVPGHRHCGERGRTRHRPAARRLPDAVEDAAAGLALPPVCRTRCGRSDWSRSRARDGRASTTSDSGGPAGWFAACGPASSPVAAAAIAAFSATGLFAGLSGLFLATTLHRPSQELSGAALFLVFSARAASPLATTRLRASRVLALGMTSLTAGLVLLVVAVRLPAASLVLFPICGALIGAGAGAVYMGTTGLVLEATEPENRVAMTSALVIAVFGGLSVPVTGAGVALTQGASPPDAVLGSAILVALGISVSGWTILGRRSTGPQQAADLPDIHA
jgi:hypothetical protein